MEVADGAVDCDHPCNGGRLVQPRQQQPAGVCQAISRGRRSSTKGGRRGGHSASRPAGRCVDVAPVARAGRFGSRRGRHTRRPRLPDRGEDGGARRAARRQRHRCLHRGARTRGLLPIRAAEVSDGGAPSASGRAARLRLRGVRSARQPPRRTGEGMEGAMFGHDRPASSCGQFDRARPRTTTTACATDASAQTGAPFRRCRDLHRWYHKDRHRAHAYRPGTAWTRPPRHRLPSAGDMAISRPTPSAPARAGGRCQGGGCKAADLDAVLCDREREPWQARRDRPQMRPGKPVFDYQGSLMLDGRVEKSRSRHLTIRRRLAADRLGLSTDDAERLAASDAVSTPVTLWSRTSSTRCRSFSFVGSGPRCVRTR